MQQIRNHIRPANCILYRVSFVLPGAGGGDWRLRCEQRGLHGSLQLLRKFRIGCFYLHAKMQSSEMTTRTTGRRKEDSEPRHAGRRT